MASLPSTGGRGYAAAATAERVGSADVDNQARGLAEQLDDEESRPVDAHDPREHTLEVARAHVERSAEAAMSGKCLDRLAGIKGSLEEDSCDGWILSRPRRFASCWVGIAPTPF